tara:strand:+ start:405 stop:743 length:339 start_codon:yes stop_codon:yes gene_type:complete
MKEFKKIDFIEDKKFADMLLLTINKNILSLQSELVERVVNSGFFSAFYWLEDKEIVDLNEIIFLRKYLREVIKRYKIVCSKEDYLNYQEDEILLWKLSLADTQLTDIIKDIR